ncbi:hypothetical protein SAMN02745704_02682 [Paucidesulfovibrio gracilis DSM 16080]|jgi:hypothetical protein|uniref:Uncharacterized protein n=1 Tax=Paucidesulfovibrio gracilis DSM 16080 TaxID=1121449 RepID=A0A1T4Y3V1_9BACT|nr:hypothetical protein [Paucidesulfovibrio gracilis]SKA95991.1 hypothetical protein SAMN02745704_02682 [Paucidesulfovibrio gracilis DSM 16080]
MAATPPSIPSPGALSADGELQRLFHHVARKQDSEMDQELEKTAPEDQEEYLDRQWSQLEERETCDS